MQTNRLEPTRGQATTVSLKKVMDRILAGDKDAYIAQCCAECRLALRNIKEEVERERQKQLRASRKRYKTRIGKA